MKERLQFPPYLLKETFNEVFSCLRGACILFPEFLHIGSDILHIVTLLLQIPLLSFSSNIR